MKMEVQEGGGDQIDWLTTNAIFCCCPDNTYIVVPCMWWTCFSLCFTTATTRCWSLSGRLQRRCGTTIMPLSSTSSSNNHSAAASLADFLRECKQQVWAATADDKEESSPLSLVIGNPAGDADSILSAITWAYVASTALASSTTRTIPILSIPRHDLTTQRPETLLLLNLAGVTPDVLVDVTDMPQQPRFQHAHVTLVDHNRLDATLESSLSLNWTVTGILDHHYDEGLYTDAVLREIAFDQDHATVASTTTLVAEHWLQQQQQSSSPKLDSDVAILLLGTILLDSVNMSPAAGKGTARDQAVLKALLAQTDWQDGKLVRNKDDDSSLWDDTGCPHPTRLFERLQQAKFDVKFWKGLCVRDALRLDYKRFTPNENGPFGASTVLLDWDTFLAKDGVSPGIAAYMEEEKVSFLAIMCTFSAADSDALQRQLVLCANKDQEPSLLNSLVDYLQRLDSDSNLQLQERTHSRVDEQLQLRVFDQGKVKASRKQVAPLLIRYFETCKA